MGRDAFLARVRSAAAAGRQYRVEVRRDLPEDTGYAGAGDDPLARLIAEAAAVGARAELVADDNAARDAIRRIVAEHRPRSSFTWEHPLLERLGLAGLLAEAGSEVFSHATLSALPQCEQRAKILAADFGVSSATFAIGETGTLAMCSAPGRERLASLAPMIYLSIIESSQVVPDLFDVFRALCAAGPDAMPSNLVLITGPSKTGDIELNLTTGVHGPGVWHVIGIR